MDYVKKWNIHKNQIVSGNDIIDNFNHSIYYNILVAQMQSGKTGVAKFVVHDLCKKDIIKKENIFFICGMNDNDLRNQAIKEFDKLIFPENILFSKQLQRCNKKTHIKFKAELIIIDESHYASNLKSQVDLFLKMARPKRDSCYTLSISATPMAEIATKEEMGKALTYLAPDKGYFGIKDIFRNGLIFDSASLSESNFESFLDIIEKEYERQSKTEWKYGIIRLPCQWYKEFTEAEIVSLDYDIEFIDHHSSNKSKKANFNDYLKKEPDRFTIIWVYNSLRAGKQLNTKLVGFIHDTTNSKCDIIAQSLLGRCFGYNKELNKVNCYTDMKSAKQMLNWVNNWYSETQIPSGCKNIDNGKTNKIKKWQLHVPLLVKFNDELTFHYRELKLKHGNRYPYKSDLLIDVVRNSSDPKVEDIIDNYIPGKCGGLMILTESNAPNSFKSFWDANYKAYKKKKTVRGFQASEKTSDKLFYIYFNLNPNSKQYSYLLITYKELIDSVRDAIHVTANHKSMYHV